MAEQTLTDERAELSGKAINDLPDSAFAYIEPGGKKDAEGKTVPRSLRHFPVHDEAHARNALARAPQSPFGDKAMPKILAAAKKFGIEVSKNSAETGAERRKKPRHRAVPLMPEIRHWAATGLEVREKRDTNEIVLSGTPIVYDEPYEVRDMFGTFTETMTAGVASEVLDRGADVRFLFNHDGLPLARTTSGTMTLTDSAEGLQFEARLDARQQLANDLWLAVQRGDVSQMSVGFVVASDEWDEDMENRTIFRFEDFLDVSAVTYPASPKTSLQVAQRMALEMPVESRARLRKLIVADRAGAVLSSSSKEKVAEAIKALHGLYTAGGGDVNDLIDDDDQGGTTEDGTQGGNTSSSGEIGVDDGTGSRSVEVDPPIKNLSALRLQIEARKRRRIAA